MALRLPGPAYAKRCTFRDPSPLPPKDSARMQSRWPLTSWDGERLAQGAEGILLGLPAAQHR